MAASISRSEAPKRRYRRATTMKSYNDPIQVQTQNGKPTIIQWRQNRYRVTRILDYWIIQNRWWHREERRIYMLLETNRATIEVYRTQSHWKLSKLID